MNVRPYTLIQTLNNTRYSGTIYAVSIEQAELIASRIEDAYIQGEDCQTEICGNCGAVLWSGDHEAPDTPRGH